MKQKDFCYTVKKKMVKKAVWEDPELTFSHRHNKYTATYGIVPQKKP